MLKQRLTPQEIGRIGEELYRTDIRPRLSEQDRGKFLALDITSGEYEKDKDYLGAADRLRARVPDAEIHEVRVGYQAAFTLAGHLPEDAL